MNGGKCKPYIPSIWDEESELNIVDNVLVAVVSGYVIIFKEKWENWQFLDIKELISYKRKMRSDKNNGKGLWAFEDRQYPSKDNDMVTNQEIISKYCVTSLFQLVTLIDINKI